MRESYFSVEYMGHSTWRCYLLQSDERAVFIPLALSFPSQVRAGGGPVLLGGHQRLLLPAEGVQLPRRAGPQGPAQKIHRRERSPGRNTSYSNGCDSSYQIRHFSSAGARVWGPFFQLQVLFGKFLGTSLASQVRGIHTSHAVH